MDSEDRSTQKDTSSSAVTSSPGHTPGPWDFEADEASSGKMFTVYDQHGIRLTDPYVGEREARLIAAAPEMFAALEELLKAENNRDAAMCGNGGLAILNASNRMSIACIRACDVLAKARSLVTAD